MRPIHLGLAALFLAAALAALWFALDLSPWIAHAGSSSRGNSRTGSAAGLGAQGGPDDAERGSDSQSSTAATRIPLAPPEELAALSQQPKKADLPRLEGRVVDPSGIGIPGASVFASSGVSWLQIPLDVEPDGLPKGWIRVERATTDAEGRFLFTELKAGPLRMAVRSAGFAPLYQDHLDLPDRPQVTLPDMRMEPGVVLSGRVIDAEGKGVEGATLLSALDGGSSAAGARVTLPGRGIPLATTEVGGRFRIDQLAAGPWRLIVDAPGQAISEEEGRTEHPGERQTGLLFHLERGFEILGRVRAEVGTLPEGLRVGARPSLDPSAAREAGTHGATGGSDDVPGAADTRARFALCTQDGGFVVRGTRNGVRYSLTLTQKSDDSSGWKRLRGTDPTSAWAGQRGIEIVYRPESALVFRVLDDRTGAPITAFNVWAGVGREQPLRDEKGQTICEFKDGRARFGDLRLRHGAAGVVLRIAASGFKDLERKNLALEPGQELDLGDLRLEPGPVVLARVVDDRTDAPVEAARVLLGAQSEADLERRLESSPDTDSSGDAGVRYARTDASGRARLSSLPGKSATAVAGARGFLPSDPVHLLFPDDRDQEIELRLKHGGTVIVRVHDARDQPVGGVGIEHKKPSIEGDEDDSAFDRGTLKTDVTGTLRFEALAPGAHAFRVREVTTDGEWSDEERQDSSEGWVESVASEGSSATLELLAPTRGGLHGEVREAGHPLEGARLHLAEIRAPGQAGAKEEGNGWYSPGSNDPYLAIADHEGQYRFEGLRCGSYRLQISHPTRTMPALFEVAIENPARAFDVDLDVASIEGRVTGDDGVSLAGIDVQARSTLHDDPGAGNWRMVLTEDDRGSPRVDYREAKPADKTDSSGRYVLRGVRTGEPLVVWASGEMVVPGKVEGITLGPDEVRRGIDFSLKYAGVIEATLAAAGPGARSRGWYQVRAIRLAADGEEQIAQTSYLGDWNRTCRLRSLAPGKYKVALAAGGEENSPPLQEQELEVVAGQVARTVFEPR